MCLSGLGAGTRFSGTTRRRSAGAGAPLFSPTDASLGGDDVEAWAMAEDAAASPDFGPCLMKRIVSFGASQQSAQEAQQAVASVWDGQTIPSSVRGVCGMFPMTRAPSGRETADDQRIRKRSGYWSFSAWIASPISSPPHEMVAREV